MKTLITNLIVLFLGIALGVACEEVQPLKNQSVIPDTMLVGSTWQLTAFVAADGDHTSPGSVRSEYSKVAYTITFTEQPADSIGSPQALRVTYGMKVIGYPNEGFFTYELKSTKERSFAIYFHGATQINLFPGSKESEFFNALRAATSYRVNGKQLRIFYDDGKALLFEPLESEAK